MGYESVCVKVWWNTRQTSHLHSKTLPKITFEEKFLRTEQRGWWKNNMKLKVTSLILQTLWRYQHKYSSQTLIRSRSLAHPNRWVKPFINWKMSWTEQKYTDHSNNWLKEPLYFHMHIRKCALWHPLFLLYKRYTYSDYSIVGIIKKITLVTKWITKQTNIYR